MTTITVATAAELEAALANATGGETILLKPGNYGDLKLGLYSPIEAQYDSEVTIVSADPDNPAVITKIEGEEVSNLTFDTIHFDYTFGGEAYNVARPFSIGNAENVTIRNSTFDGDVASGTGTSADDRGNGFGVSISGTGVVIENNEFHTWYKAIAVTGEDIVISGNDIHSIRSDGINVVRVEGIVIEGNHFHNFEGADESSDHRDMIQFWTNGATTPSTDIVIRDNVFDIAEGDATQTIFMRNDMVDRGLAGEEMFYQDVLIEGNVITNAHHHGITVGETDGLIIRNNTVVQRTGENDQIDTLAPVTIPKINVAPDSTDVLIEGNIAGAVSSGIDGWIVRDNVIIQAINPADEGYVSDIFVDSSLVSGQPIVLPGSAADDIGAGAPASYKAAGASFSVHDSEEGPSVFVFDATAATGGQVIPGATYEWFFMDGTTATGPVVSRDFGEPGMHGVILQVTTAKGAVSQAGLTVEANDTTVVELVGDDILVFSGETFETAGAEFSTQHSKGLDLGAPGVAASVPDESLQRVYSAEEIEMSMTLSADTAGASGIVLHLYSAVRISVKGDGSLSVEVFLGQDGKIVLESPPNLFVGKEPVDIRLSYDANAGKVELFTDGKKVDSASFDGEIGGSSEGLAFGDAWGKQNFDGTLSDFSLEVVDAVHNPYEGDLEPIEVTELGQPSQPQTLNLETMLAHEDSVQIGRIRIAEDDDGPKVELYGTPGFVKLGGASDIVDDGNLTASVTFDRGEDNGTVDRLLWNKGIFGIDVKDDKVLVRVGTADEGLKTYKAQVDGLDEEGDKTISVAIDSDLDRIQIMVDGEVVLDDTGSADISVYEENPTGHGWMVGAAGKRHFNGEISEVEFNDDALFDRGESQQIVDDASLLG